MDSLCSARQGASNDIYDDLRSRDLRSTFDLDLLRSTYILVMSITANRDTDTKPNTNNIHGKIPKPNRLGNIRKIPTFYQILSLFSISEDS